MERTAKQAHAVLYHKGPLLLARLEQKMGQALFTELLRSLVRQPKKDTAGFLGILTELSGRKVADWFRDQLKE